jgi:uncharacterized membrane protein YqaE (UPF0057 family)
MTLWTGCFGDAAGRSRKISELVAKSPLGAQKGLPAMIAAIPKGRVDEAGGCARRVNAMIKVLLVLLCLVLPFLAVLLKDGPSLKVLWAFLLQLCGHIPGVIYGIYQVVKD